MLDLHEGILGEFAERARPAPLRAVDAFGRVGVQKERPSAGTRSNVGRCTRCGRRDHQRRQCANREDWNEV